MQLLPHQQVMLDAMAKEEKGYLTCGTGGGKTFTMITDCRRFLAPGNVIVIVAPQLLLGEQLFNEFSDHLCDIDFVYRQVSSESKTWQRNPKKLKFGGKKVQARSSTTTVDEIVDIYRIAQKAKQPLILFTTYLSLERIVKANIPVDVTYYDEAHNAATTDKNIFNSVKDQVVSSSYNFFFTATPKYSSSPDGCGMQNESVYGKKIAAIKFSDLVKCGAIVKPYLHLQTSNVQSRDLDEISIDVDALMETINYYETKHYETGAHKVLVACRGTENIQGMRNAMLKWANDKGYDILSVDSVNGGYLNDQQISTPASKGKFLDELNTMGKDLTRKMIVLHYDMLGEGIDVKAFTGTVFLRNICSNIKAVQAMGRVIRSSPGKKYGIVTVIQHGDDTDDAYETIGGIVNQLIINGATYEDMLTEVSGRGKDEEIIEELESEMKKRIKDYEVQWWHDLMIQDLLSSGDPLDIL